MPHPSDRPLHPSLPELAPPPARRTLKQSFEDKSLGEILGEILCIALLFGFAGFIYLIPELANLWR